ncbi:MAG: MutT/NUDIX family protein [uncultured bacterium]|nr:MAG: MutT/NUDIX family protein [uncultured bacterium]
METITCRDLNRNEEEVSIDKLSFRPSVYGLMIKDEKILLARQWDGYDFPGGAIEINEGIQDALVREIKEETGLDVKPGKIITAENCFFKMPAKGNYVNSILLYYLCDVIGGELSDKNFSENEKSYASMPEWVNISDLDKIKLYSSAENEKIINEALRIYNQK